MSVTFSKTHLDRLLSGSTSGSSSSSAGPASGSGAIAILDTLEQSALPLLSAFATTAASRSRPLLVLCIQHSPHAWHSLLPLAAPHAAPVQVVDLAPYLPFPSSTAKHQGCWIKAHMVPPITRLLAKPTATAHSPLILIDSLNPLVPLYPTPTHFARSLSSLLSLTSSSATLILPLTHSPSTQAYADALTYLAPTTLGVANAARALRELSVITDRPQGDLGLDTTSNCATDVVVHLSSVKGGSGGGKVVSECVRMTLAPSGWSYALFPPQEQPVVDKKAAGPIKSESETDPTQGLSFNLKLTDKQREAKDKVVLPHFKMQQFGDGETTGGDAGGGGVIHYELDLEDDFDDEDPDADLDL